MEDKGPMFEARLHSRARDLALVHGSQAAWWRPRLLADGDRDDIESGRTFCVKRTFQYVRGQTQVFYEIQQHGLRVAERWWGPKRKEYVETHRFGSPSSASQGVTRLILEQRNRGFHEMDSAGRAIEEIPLIPVYGAAAVRMAKQAILLNVIPKLRASGFKGTFPVFRRIEREKHALVWFSWGRAGGFVSCELAVMPPKKATTIARDYGRVPAPFSRNRKSLNDLIPRSRWLFLFFDRAAEKWGVDWPTPMSEILLAAFQGPGERWLRRSKAT